MALNIGSLVGYLELDDRQFTRKADAADKKLSALKLHLEALSKSDPKIKVQVDAEVAKIDALKAKIEELKARAARGIDVRVDMVQALVELDAIQAKVNSLHGKEIKVDVDTKSARQNVSALGTAIALLAPTIGPVAASAAGMSVAVGSVFAAGAVGIGLWAKAAQTAAKSTLKQQKAIEKAQKRVEKAKTPEGKASAKKQLEELKALNAQQERFIKGQGAVKAAWSRLATSQATFRPMAAGMTVLTSIIPKLKPLLDAVSRSLVGVIHDVGKWVDSGGFDRFIKGFSALAGPSITIGMRTLGNFAKGFGGMAKAFGPLGLQMASSMERMSQSFAKWGNNSEGLQQFVAYVSVEGPKVMHLLGDVISAVVHLGLATAPIGTVILNVLSGIAQGINMIPVPLLAPLASGLIAVNLALKLFAATTAVTNAVGLVRVSEALGNMSKLKFSTAAAGLGVMAASAGQANKSIGVLGMAAGGAMTGFAVGGPWGAAIGAGAGALIGLAAKTMKSGEAFDASADDADRFADSLRGITAAATDQARVQIIDTMAKEGTLKTGNDLGLTNRQLTNATLGNEGAQDKVYAAIKQERIKLKSEMDKARADFARLAGIPFAKQGADYGEKLNAASEAVRKTTDAYKDQGKALDELSSRVAHNSAVRTDEAAKRWRDVKVTDAYAKALRALPPRVQSRIEAMNVAPTLGDIARIASQYKKVDKRKLESLLRAVGVDATVADIQRVINKQKGIERRIPVTVAFTVLGMGNVLRAQQQANAMSRVNATVGGGTKRASGGRISGPGSGTSDSIVANVSNGEFIVNARATKRHLPLLAAINAGNFASGGQVGRRRRAAARKYDQTLLDQYVAMLAKTDTKISDAKGFGAAFAGNVFAQGFTGASGAMSTARPVNGSMVSTSTGPSTAGILEQMFAYQSQQYTQAKTLDKDITRLRKLGVSKTLLDQMQSAGASGATQIHALASGSASQVKQFNKRAVQTERLLNDAGAQATSGVAMSSLQKQQASQHSIIKGIREAIKDGVKVHVVHGHVRPV